MNGYLVDTNAISEFVKPAPHANVVAWFRSVDPEGLFASVVTFGEIRLGIKAMPIGKRRSELELWIEDGLSGWFASNLLPVTREIADRWARLTIAARRRGMTLATMDGLIAATALVNDLAVVTRNTKDFAGLAVAVMNPWEN